MKQNLLNKLWLRVCLIAAIMTTAFSGAVSAEEVTFDFPAIASANSWENGVAYTSYTISPITVEALGGGNNGKYYTSSNGSWRMYSGGTVRISAEEGYTVTNVVSTPSCTFTIADGVATFSPTARTDFKTITVTYVAAGVTPSVATPIIMGVENFLTSTEVSIACGTEGAAILYNTGGDTWETYSEPFTLTETTTIQAKATKSGMNDSEVATKTFTKTVPYTVAEARAAIDAGTGTQGVYATGIVSAIPTAYNASYENITFNFVDAEGDEVFLPAYRCGGAEAADVQVGDVVVVYGNLTKYGSTYEFGQGCELISLTHSSTPAEPVIVAENATIAADVTSYELMYSIENPVEGTVLTATTDASWITSVTPSTESFDRVMIECEANEGEERTATITLTYGTATKDVTLTQEAYVAPVEDDYVTLPYSWAGGKSFLQKQALQLLALALTMQQAMLLTM